MILGFGLIVFVQQGLLDYFRRIKAFDDARPDVEQVGVRSERFPAVGLQVRAFQRQLANQSVGSLDGACLPSSVLAAEFHHHDSVVCLLGRAHHLLYRLVGQCLMHWLGHFAQLSGDVLQRRGSCHIGEFDQKQLTRVVFKQWAHRRAFAHFLDEINSLATGACPVARLGLMLRDDQQIERHIHVIFAPTTWHTFILVTAQTGDQIFANLASSHRGNAGLDCSVQDGSLWFIGPHDHDCSWDLGGLAAFDKNVLSQTVEQGVVGQLGGLAVFESQAPRAKSSCMGIIYLPEVPAINTDRSGLAMKRLRSQVMVDARGTASEPCNAPNSCGASS